MACSSRSNQRCAAAAQDVVGVGQPGAPPSPASSAAGALAPETSGALGTPQASEAPCATTVAQR
eukprot:3001857-Alexandrium_andersonii.AAC.1